MTLVGDACHPIMPFMPQGAALARYEAMRRARASQIQIGSRGNNRLREGGNADWVYGYDAWAVPLAAAVPATAQGAGVFTRSERPAAPVRSGPGDPKT